MKILVAGGAGFIGSHLIDRLLKDGHHILCLDDLSSGLTSNLIHHFSNDKFSMMEFDICTVDTPFKLKSETFDEIYNLASPAAPSVYKLNPMKTLDTNIKGTIKLLDLAQRTHAKYLQTSTIRVIEGVNHLGPNAPYVEGKRMAETLSTIYLNKLGADVRIARLFSVYGPRMSKYDGRVIPEFIRRATTNEDIHIFGDGNQLDSFTYVEDVVDGLIRFMEADISIAHPRDPVEFGYNPRISIMELAKAIIDLTKSKSKIYHIKGESRDVKAPDDFARIAFDWIPKINHYEGLKRTIESFK